jgi:hypothetical protein
VGLAKPVSKSLGQVVVSKDATAERLAQLPTRKEMYRAVLLGTTTGACLMQCLAWLFHG